jgi:hypothetical protein
MQKYQAMQHQLTLASVENTKLQSKLEDVMVMKLSLEEIPQNEIDRKDGVMEVIQTKRQEGS